MRLFVLTVFVLLSACQTARLPAPAKINHPEEDHSVTVLVSATGQRARDLIHEVAARCWLDGVVAGAQLIVKPGGNVEVVGDKYLLVAADYAGLKGARSRWKLTGTAVRDPAKRARLVETLDFAARTGETACPSIVS
ncbi:MAG: hypothetical protein AAF479_05585 [Pseudomonadota bacterium]